MFVTTIQSENQGRSAAIRDAIVGAAQLSRDGIDASRLVHEDEPAYMADRTCFICGHGDDKEALLGSTPLCDWVHPGCLSKPLVWD